MENDEGGLLPSVKKRVGDPQEAGRPSSRSRKAIVKKRVAHRQEAAGPSSRSSWTIIKKREGHRQEEGRYLKCNEPVACSLSEPLA